VRRRSGHIHQLSVSRGGVPKRPVAEARLEPLGLEGDVQADRRRHGGTARALCLFALEVLEALRAQGHPIGPGSTGENVTLCGIDWREVVPGARLRLGVSALVEITDFAAPCLKNALWFSDGDVQRISQWSHPGCSRVYARVLSGGLLRAGDTAELLTADPARAGQRIRTVRWKPPGGSAD
jgi:MOSC domain-containing protein YiiM